MHRRVRKRRIIPLFAVLLIIGIAVGAFSAYRISRPLPSLNVTLTPLAQSAAKPVTFTYPASGAAIIGQSDGTILGQGSAVNQKRPIASVAKLITVLTVLKKYPLEPDQPGPTLTLTDADVALYAKYQAANGSVVPVQAGEKISESAMIQAMLLPSANNMADTLATWAFGSLESYRTQATLTITGLRMTNTVIGQDASGFSDTTTSTAGDLFKLARAASADPVIKRIATEPTATIPVVGTVATTNFDLGQDGITGLKTGTGDTGNNNFVFTSDHTFAAGQSRSFVGVILGSVSESSRFQEARTLLEKAYASYALETPINSGQTVGTLTSAWGDTSQLTADGDLTTLRYAANAETLTPDITVKTVPVTKGQTVGTIKDGAASVTVKAGTPINPPSLWWRLVH